MPFILKTGNLKIKDANNQYHEVNTLIGDTSDAAIQEIKTAANDIVANVEGELTQQLNAAISNANEKAGSANTAATAANTAANTANNAKNNLESQFSALIKLLIKDQWDETVTYSSGDYVLYNNKIYKCFVATSTVGQFKNDEWIESENSLVQRLNLLYNDIQSELSDLQIKWDNPQSETGIIQEWNKIRNSWDSTSPMFLSQLDSGILQQWNTIKLEWSSTDTQSPGLKKQCEEAIGNLNTEKETISTFVEETINANLTRITEMETAANATEQKIDALSEHAEQITNTINQIKDAVDNLSTDTLIQQKLQEITANFLHNQIPVSTCDIASLLNILITWENNTASNITNEDFVRAVLLGIKNTGTSSFKITDQYPLHPLIQDTWLGSQRADIRALPNNTTLISWFQSRGRWFDLTGVVTQSSGLLLQPGDIVVTSTSTLSIIINKSRIETNNGWRIIGVTWSGNTMTIDVINNIKSFIRPLYNFDIKQSLGIMTFEPIFGAILTANNDYDIVAETSNSTWNYLCTSKFLSCYNKKIQLSLTENFVQNPSVKIFYYDKNYQYSSTTDYITLSSTNIITNTVPDNIYYARFVMSKNGTGTPKWTISDYNKILIDIV